MDEILLVDGVGHTRAVELPDDGIPPIIFRYAHEGRVSGPEREIEFVRSEDVDPLGRVIYRQRDKGMPDIRYIAIQKPKPLIPKLRIENSTGE